MRRTALAMIRRRIPSYTSQRSDLLTSEFTCSQNAYKRPLNASRIRPLSTTSWTNTRDSEDLQRFFNQFVNKPIGELDDDDWEDLEYCLRKCCRRGSDPNSVQLSFQVLDRIVQEANPPPANFNPLNMVVMNWKNVYQKKQDKNIPTPQAMVDQIDKWRRADDNDESCLQPDARTYTMIIEALGKTKMHEKDILFAGGLLEWMLEESKTQFQIQPTTHTFAAVMNILAKSGLPDPPQKIKALIDKMKVLQDEGWADISPNLVVYNTWLHSLSRAGNVEEAQRVLQQMLTGEIPGVEPDRISFTELLSGYAKQHTQHAAESAETLVSQMHKLYKSGGYDSLKPNIISYTIVMDCYAKLGQGEKAEALLRKLLQLYQETNDPDWEADLATYNTVLLAWARSNQPKNADRFLQFLYEEADVAPDERSFNIVLSAWAKIGNAEQAELILTRMHELYVEGELDTQPTTVTYNTVLDSWKNSNQENAWKRSIKILDYMMELYDAGEKAVKPNERTWNAVLNALAKAGRVDLASRYLDKFTKAYEQGEVDEGPSIRAWNALLAACLKGKDIETAQKIWLQLQNNQRSPSADVVTYNTLLNCYAKTPQRKRYRNQLEATFQRLQHDPNVKPNKISYLAMVNYWIQSRQVDKAEGLLDEWCENHDLLGTSFLDRDLFHVVLNGWSHAKEPRKAEALVLKMAKLSEQPNHHNLEPNVETYNRLLNVWARSSARDAGERADAILRQMQSFAIGSDSAAVAPDIISYNSVLNSWANSGDPTAVTRIEGLIMEMILKGVPALTPTLVSYGTWLKAIENSGEEDKPRRAREVLKTMKIHQLEPSEYILQKVKSFSGGTNKEKN